jgi:hypothetical protein
MAVLETQMLEIKELLATLVVSQTRTLPTPEDTPIPTEQSPTRNTPKTVRLPPL